METNTTLACPNAPVTDFTKKIKLGAHKQMSSLRLTNCSLAFCLLALVVNTVLFCRSHDGCEVIPGRSKLGSTPTFAIMNTELTFLTLMTAHAPISLVQQQFKGAQISNVRIGLSFLLPILVAICFTFDIKRYPDAHQFLAYIIMGSLLGMALNSYWLVLGGVLAALIVTRIKFSRNKRQAKEKRDRRGGIVKFFLGGNIVNLFFGLGVFFPMFYIMYRNEYYASLV